MARELQRARQLAPEREPKRQRGPKRQREPKRQRGSKRKREPKPKRQREPRPKRQPERAPKRERERIQSLQRPYLSAVSTTNSRKGYGGAGRAAFATAPNRISSSTERNITISGKGSLAFHNRSKYMFRRLHVSSCNAVISTNNVRKRAYRPLALLRAAVLRFERGSQADR